MRCASSEKELWPLQPPQYQSGLGMQKDFDQKHPEGAGGPVLGTHSGEIPEIGLSIIHSFECSCQEAEADWVTSIPGSAERSSWDDLKGMH